MKICIMSIVTKMENENLKNLSDELKNENIATLLAAINNVM